MLRYTPAVRCMDASLSNASACMEQERARGELRYNAKLHACCDVQEPSSVVREDNMHAAQNQGLTRPSLASATSVTAGDSSLAGCRAASSTAPVRGEPSWCWWAATALVLPATMFPGIMPCKSHTHLLEPLSLHQPWCLYTGAEEMQQLGRKEVDMKKAWHGRPP